MSDLPPPPATPPADELLRYHALFDNPVIGVRVSSVAEDGRIVDSNLAYRRMTGYSAAELARLTLLDLTHPDDRAHNRELYDELRAGRRASYQIEKRLLRKDGSCFWARLTALALLDPDGAAIHHLGLVEDVDDRHRAVEDLGRANERLHALLNAAADGIVLIDTAGTIQLANPALEAMFGYSPAELEGQNVSVLMPQPHRERHDGHIARYLETGEARIIGIGRQLEGRRRDGSVFPLDLAVTEIRHGGERFFLGTLRDISERLRLETEIRQAQKMEAVGRLAGGVAHDFNTLLGTILGYSEILLASLPPGTPTREPADRIFRAAQRGAQLTRQLLLFSRRQELQAQLVDLADALADMNAMLDRLIREDVRLTLHVEPGLGRVRGDPGEMHQVLLNLILNACDAMPAGGALAISLVGHNADEDIPVVGGRLPPGSYVCLEVRDTGSGMDERVQTRVFEPFFTTKEAGSGTGLGLATVHAVVQRCHGGIHLESRPGQGSIFRVYLPVAAPSASPPPQAQEAAPSSPPRQGQGTILLVEDDEMFRGLLHQILADHGYSVLTADCPEAALAVAAAAGRPIDLLLSDMIMPGGTGAGLARRLTGQFSGLTTVLMSGYTDDTVAASQPDRGIAQAFLEKPFSTRALLDLLADLLPAPAD